MGKVEKTRTTKSLKGGQGGGGGDPKIKMQTPPTQNKNGEVTSSPSSFAPSEFTLLMGKRPPTRRRRIYISDSPDYDYFYDREWGNKMVNPHDICPLRSPSKRPSKLVSIADSVLEILKSRNALLPLHSQTNSCTDAPAIRESPLPEALPATAAHQEFPMRPMVRTPSLEQPIAQRKTKKRLVSTSDTPELTVAKHSKLERMVPPECYITLQRLPSNEKLSSKDSIDKKPKSRPSRQHKGKPPRLAIKPPPSVATTTTDNQDLAVVPYLPPSPNSKVNSKMECCRLERWQRFRNLACKQDKCDLLIDTKQRFYRLRKSVELEMNFKERIFICRECYRKCQETETKTIFIRERHPEFNPRGEVKELDRYSFIVTNDPEKNTPEEIFLALNELEPTINCVSCSRTFHSNCVLYDRLQFATMLDIIDPHFHKWFKGEWYICDQCCDQFTGNGQRLVLSGTPSPVVEVKSISFPSERLVKTPTSSRMQSHLETFLHRECSAKNIPQPTIWVREVYSKMQEFEAKPLMKKQFEENKMPSKFKFIQRTLMLFYKDAASGKDVTIFSLIVQEYPESSRVNVSYLDSVKLFEPNTLRSELYRRVVVSYLHTVHNKYEHVYLWVCPPTQGDEYVFHGRPDEAQNGHPKNIAGLIRWYARLMDICIEEGIIESYKQASNTCDPYGGNFLNMPYLKDDFWIDKLEEVLASYEKEKKIWESKSTKSKKRTKPRTIQKLVNEKVKSEGSNQLFVVKFKKTPTNLKNTDVETDILCDYMSTRDRFIIDCRENVCDFSDIRRGAFATLTMMSSILQESISKRCSECNKRIYEGKYCYQCPSDELYCNNCCLKHDPCSEHQITLRRFQVPATEINLSSGEMVELRNKITRWKEVIQRVGQFIQMLCFMGDTLAGNTTNCRIIGGKLLQTNYFHCHIELWRQDKLPEEPPPGCSVCRSAWKYLRFHKGICKGVECNLPICSSSSLFNSKFADSAVTTYKKQQRLSNISRTNQPVVSIFKILELD